MALLLRLTDGTTTCNLVDGTNYEAVYDGWAPAVAPLRRSALGGGGPYDEVTEEILVNVRGASMATAHTNLKTLAQLLEQAERWARGESALPVLLQHTPKAGALQLQSVVVGRAEGDQTAGVQLAPTWNETINAYVIRNVRLRLRRRGLWHLATPVTATSASVNNGAVATLTYAATLVTPCPTRLRVNSVYAGINSELGLLVVSQDSKGIGLLPAENLADAGVYTSVADAGKLPRDTNILRYTPGVTTEVETAADFPSVNGATTRFAIFANIRNNSNTTTFQVRASVKTSSSLSPKVYTPIKVIPPYVGAARPKWEFLGTVGVPQYASALTLLCTASAAAGTLDFDTILVLDLAQPFWLLEIRNDGMTAGAGATTTYLTVDPRMDSGQYHRPELHFNTVATDTQLTYAGDLNLATQGAGFYAVWLATGGGSGKDFWRQENGAGALLAGTMVADRYTAYLIPE